jgi:hypothetical protein
MADFSMNVNYAKPQTSSLGDMLNMASGMQQFQQAQQMNPLALEKAQVENQVLRQKNDERLKLQEFTSNPDNWQTDGRIDMEKINSVIPRIAPLTGSAVINELSGLHKSQTEANKAKQELTQSQREIISSRTGLLGRLGVQDPKIVLGELERLKEENPNNPELNRLIDAYSGPLKRAKPGKHIAEDMVRLSQSLLSSAQQESLSPKAGLLDTGGEIQPTVTQPFIGGQQPLTQMVGTAIPKTIGPGQQQIATEGNPYNLPVGTAYIPPSAATKQNAPMVTGLAPQVSSTIGANTTIANQDWEKTYQEAREAQPRIAIFQNIKKLAPDAFTGVGGERKKLAAGILNAAGIDAYTAENTATDELAKNTRLLALAGGNTDAARAMAEIANPSNKMTLAAIKEVSDQMIGAERLREKRAEYLGQFRNDPVKYQEKSQLFNQFADPRIFQEMTPEQVAKLKASMSKQDIAEMSRKIQQAKMLGIIK